MSAVTFNMKGGRSSVSGIKATVFGASGFLGQYVVNRLGKIGSSVVVPFRGDELWVRKMKPMGDLGQINLYPMSIRNVEEIETAVAGSNVVINLLGSHLETRRAASPRSARSSSPCTLCVRVPPPISAAHGACRHMGRAMACADLQDLVDARWRAPICKISST